MDGDHAPLRELAELKEKYAAWLMVDDAHATGLYGPNRRGLVEELGVSDRIEIQMGTLGKALGAGQTLAKPFTREVLLKLVAAAFAPTPANEP